MNTRAKMAGRMMLGATVALLGGLLLAVPALADPGGKGKGHGNQGNNNQGNNNQGQPSLSFSVNDRSLIGGYYTSMIQSGHCPPGLAKKNNACMPPGQAKKWSMGQRLPAGLTVYPLPPHLLAQLNPPAGYRYVQVGSDVLMLAVGTSMVVSALQGIIR